VGGVTEPPHGLWKWFWPPHTSPIGVAEPPMANESDSANPKNQKTKQKKKQKTKITVSQKWLNYTILF
jgi:hypothetical protein